MKLIAPILLLLLALVLPMLFSQQPDLRNTFQVSGTGMPASLTIPTADGGAVTLNRTVRIAVLSVVNTGASSGTFTVQDCQTTPFVLFKAQTLAAGANLIQPLYGTPFNGCLKWSASATTMMGSIVGQ